MRYTIIDNFLTNIQCKELIDKATPRLYNSVGWNVKNEQSEISEYRTSQHMFFGLGEDIVRTIEQKVADVTHIPIENGEALQVVHYLEGKYYKAHWDYFDPSWPGNQCILKRGGQRIITALLYLNTLSSGGETYFPYIDLNVEPKEGRAIIWHNVDENGNIDNSMFHEGKPVEKGEKWIATNWLREYEFK